MDYMIGVDIGTTSVKTDDCVFNYCIYIFNRF